MDRNFTEHDQSLETKKVETGKIDCMFALNQEEERLLEKFRDLSSEQKARLTGYMAVLLDEK